MSGEIKQQPAKSSVLFKLAFYGALVSCASWLSLMIYYGNFVNINPELYARTFMVWRNKGGDASMFEGRYKGYKINDYEENPKFTNFIKFAQTEDGYLIAGNYPLHAPREPEYLHTLIDPKEIVKELWKIQFNIKALLNNKKTQEEKDTWRKEAMKSMKDKKYELEFKPKWFKENKNITSQQIKEAFIIDNKPSIWWKAAPCFLDILTKLSQNEKDYKFKNGKVSESLYKDIEILMNHLGYKASDYKEEINNFFLNMATVKASPYETFIYSRLFNLYTYLTINHEFKYQKKIQKEDEKRTDEIHSKEKAEIFSHIFANVYEKPFDHNLKNENWTEYLTRIFGASQKIEGINKNQSENIEESLKKARSNLSTQVSQ
ncbi:spore wall protein 9 (SWP9) [Vairimorpha necatrix]|uniref:Spore wall protein 9 (SWP9) n=1 Tax=Vairimorpha necatrix TaxID=6039 RepID=A0AAX4J922_9MICR